MEKRTSWKWALLAVLTAFSLWLVIPLKKIHLGLDLQGGSSFIVAIDETAVREEIKRKAGKNADEAEIKAQVRDAMNDAQSRALEVIRNRIDELGTQEPSIYPEKGNNRIVIQLPGADKKQRDEAAESIQRVAFLAFHLVHKDNERLVDELLAKGVTPPGYKIVSVDGESYYKRVWTKDESAEQRKQVARGFGNEVAPRDYTFFLYRRYLEKQNMELFSACCAKQRFELSGETLKDARGEISPLGQRYVSLEFDNKGARLFARVTREYAPNGERNAGSEVGRQLAVVLDGVVFSAPTIKTVIPNGRAIIEGHFPGNEADKLAMVLRTGSLPAPVRIIEKRIVDPTLGRDSIRSGVRSILIGGVAVVVFMLIYYMLNGVIANIALLLDLILLPAGMVIAAGFMGTLLGTHGGSSNAFSLPVLTLPGIAGILLTIGMAVDANVLIFERMREEFKTGRSLLSAIEAGYDRAFVTIVDANITTLLTGIILFLFGSGPVRGFAVTLCGGILVSMFTVLVVTRMIYEVIAPRLQGTSLKMLSVVKDNIAVDFVAMRKYAVSGSAVVIALTLGLAAMRGMRDPSTVLGVDFVSGSSVTFSFDQKPGVDELRSALESGGVTGPQIQYQKEMDGSAEFLHVKSAFGTAGQVKEILPETFPKSNFVVKSEDEVGAQVSGELQVRALKAIIGAMIGIVIYLSWRFELGFAVGAIVALLHDVFITIGLYCLLGRQINLPIVAALLTIVGYSVNDTIVVFDRIREDLRLNRSAGFKDICNLSINQTLSRTLLTSVTTLLAVLMLVVFGGGAINDFALALLIGVIVGTYSSIYIATPVVLLWHHDKRPEFARATATPKSK